MQATMRVCSLSNAFATTFCGAHAEHLYLRTGRQARFMQRTLLCRSSLTKARLLQLPASCLSSNANAINGVVMALSVLNGRDVPRVVVLRNINLVLKASSE
eukprot:9532576-Alexandrium_andersonii.AAC.1